MSLAGTTTYMLHMHRPHKAASRFWFKGVTFKSLCVYELNMIVCVFSAEQHEAAQISSCPVPLMVVLTRDCALSPIYPVCPWTGQYLCPRHHRRAVAPRRTAWAGSQTLPLRSFRHVTRRPRVGHLCWRRPSRRCVSVAGPWPGTRSGPSNPSGSAWRVSLALWDAPCVSWAHPAASSRC